jgi:hypothetical protein
MQNLPKAILPAPRSVKAMSYHSKFLSIDTGHARRVGKLGWRNFMQTTWLIIGVLGLALLLAAPGTSRADNLFVANSQTVNYGVIEKFNSAGVGTVFASGSIGPSVLAGPTGLAFDSNGNLYVANYGQANILKYSPSGIGTVFESGIDPWAITLDSAGNLYVSSGIIIYKFNSSGIGTVFAHPVMNYYFTSLAFDSAGNLYAADPDAGIIEKFDSSGNGTVFVQRASNYAFMALAFDRADNLYVANNNGTIEKFDTSGAGTVFANSGVSYPTALAFDSAGTLYVANQYNNTIVKFDSSGNPTVFANSGSYGNAPAAIAFEPSPRAVVALGVGIWTNQFGFNITGTSNLVVVVEACSNLANPVWIPIGTNTLNTFLGTNGTSYFSDPQWTNHVGRFYRIRSPGE